MWGPGSQADGSFGFMVIVPESRSLKRDVIFTLSALIEQGGAPGARLSSNGIIRRVGPTSRWGYSLATFPLTTAPRAVYPRNPDRSIGQTETLLIGTFSDF